MIIKLLTNIEKILGAELAKENDVEADIVVPVPDSGNAAALGFAQYLKINFEHRFNKKSLCWKNIY